MFATPLFCGMEEKLVTRAKTLMVSAAALSLLSGCGSMLNPAENGSYACPGMPHGVICKTPAAVYKSTNGDVASTEFDQPIGVGQPEGGTLSKDAIYGQQFDNGNTSVGVKPGPRPVREPARVARIWIAPWVDKNDSLHLAQILYTEIKPRTWTVGKQEVASGGGYVIPHKAFAGIEAPKAINQQNTQQSVTPTVNSQSNLDAAELVAPRN